MVFCPRYYEGMKPRITALRLLCIAIAAAGAAAGPASAATTRIGAVNEIAANSDPDPISAGGSTVQVAEAASTYAVPAGYGVITGWSHKTGSNSGTLTFKVYRPTGAPKEFRAIAADTRTVTAGAVESFPVRIPVEPGDRIGLSADSVQVAYQTFDPSDRIGFFDPDPGPAPGTTDVTDGEPFQNFKLDVAATLESDVNGDGIGDDSQRPGGAAGAPLAAVGRQSISPRAFPAATTGSSATAAKPRKYGAKVTYSLNMAATVRFSVTQTLPGRKTGAGKKAHCVAQSMRNRKARKCTRLVTLKGSFMQTGRAGFNSFHFTGRLGGRRLKPGRYALVATPSANGKTGKPVSTAFRIVK